MSLTNSWWNKSNCQSFLLLSNLVVIWAIFVESLDEFLEVSEFVKSNWRSSFTVVEVVGGVVSLEVVADEEEAVAGLLNDGKVVEWFDSDNSTLVIVTMAVEIKFGFIISAAFWFKDVEFKVLKLTVV